MDNLLYRQLVGILLYLTHSQPHLEYYVSFVSRYIQQPCEIHWKASKRILHYVQGTKHFEVHYGVGSPLKLVGFTNSDWDGDPIEKNSTSSYVFMIENGPICW